MPIRRATFALVVATAFIGCRRRETIHEDDPAPSATSTSKPPPRPKGPLEITFGGKKRTLKYAQTQPWSDGDAIVLSDRPLTCPTANGLGGADTQPFKVVILLLPGPGGAWFAGARAVPRSVLVLPRDGRSMGAPSMLTLDPFTMKPGEHIHGAITMKREKDEPLDGQGEFDAEICSLPEHREPLPTQVDPGLVAGNVGGESIATHRAFVHASGNSIQLLLSDHQPDCQSILDGSFLVSLSVASTREQPNVGVAQPASVMVILSATRTEKADQRQGWARIDSVQWAEDGSVESMTGALVAAKADPDKDRAISLSGHFKAEKCEP
jgi:hypothetical protein